MKIDLTGKTAIVTGSTAGIGFAIAKGLVGAGATVIVNGRAQVAIDEAICKLSGTMTGVPVRGVAADVGTAAGCASLVGAEPTADILVNNVGIAAPKDFFETPDGDWTHFFEVNVMSGVRLSRSYLPGMAKRNWGRVLFISSESALNIPANMIHYGFTKTAGLSISRGLAKRMAGTGVTVNTILPGPTLSDGLVGMLRSANDAASLSIEELGTAFVMAHRSSSIIRRAATVEEVANLAVYVASAQASATTGAALRVDGGIIETIA